MIVFLRGTSLFLVTQPDHAALSARLMRHWRAPAIADSPDSSALLLAIEEHDHGWREVDAAPIVDEGSGRILDFVGVSDSIRQGVWPRGVARLAATPYAAALVAQHALHVFRRYRPDPAWAGFFNEMEDARALHAGRAAPLTLDDVLRDYAFLRIGDLLSLTFCNGWTDVQTDTAGSGYEIRLEGTRLLVTPDPFEGREVPFEIAGRELPDRPYRSAADAHAAWASAPRVVIKGICLGSSGS